MEKRRKIGAHVSVSGGLLRAIERAQKIGANCMQIFSSPPQQWRSYTYSHQEMEEFKAKVYEKNLLPVFVHAPYLINLASDNPVIVDRSVNSLILDLKFVAHIGGAGVIFHLGSHHLGWNMGKRDELINTFGKILRNSPQNTLVIIENSAGSGNKLGVTLEELRQIKEDLDNDRIKICLDTAHLFAAGYDLRTRESVGEFIREVEKFIGWDKIVAIHANDSKTELGSNVDRHENIGEGKIGLEGFKALLHNPKLKNIPFIIETPGFEREGPDKKNIDVLRKLI